jgi:hypothetical protein
MESLAHVADADPVVEVLEWINPHSGSRLVSNFARAHILISLFDGDPEKWLQFILRDGSADERTNDVPFLQEVRRRATEDPGYLPRLRDAIRAVSALLD